MLFRKPKAAAANLDFQEMPGPLDDTQIDELVAEFAGNLAIIPGVCWNLSIFSVVMCQLQWYYYFTILELEHGLHGV